MVLEVNRAGHSLQPAFGLLLLLLVCCFATLVAAAENDTQTDTDMETTIRTQLTASEFIASLPLESFQRIEIAKEYFRDKVKGVNDVALAGTQAELDKKIAVTETLLLEVKIQKPELLDDAEERTSSQLAALNNIDVNLKAVQDAKDYIANSLTTLPARQAHWNSTVYGLYAQLEQYAALAGVHTVTACLLIVLLGLLAAAAAH